MEIAVKKFPTWECDDPLRPVAGLAYESISSLSVDQHIPFRSAGISPVTVQLPRKSGKLKPVGSKRDPKKRFR